MEIFLGPKIVVNIDNLCRNFSIIKRHVGLSKIFAVIKADAYGHGIVRIAKELEKIGADGFCVANFNEIRLLIDAGIRSDILYLGGLIDIPYAFHKYRNIIYTISSYQDLLVLSSDEFTKRAHIKIDTGMNRLGLKDINDVLRILNDASKDKTINIEGIFSHFASSDDINSDYYKVQLSLFKKMKINITKNYGSKLIFHIANSSAIFRDNDTHFNLVRPGLSLYGCKTNAIVNNKLKPVMEFKSYIIHTKEVIKGESIGYNQKFFAKTDMKIGIVQVGYADGILTDFMNIGEVVLRDKKIRILGKISMDTICIDLTNQQAERGELISIWGDPVGLITLEYLSKKFKRIPYELLTSISGRVDIEYV